MWTIVWWVLALAAVATFVLVGWSLWRSGRDLVREVSATGRAADRFSAALAERTSADTQSRAPVVAQLDDTMASHRARLASLRAERAARSADRRVRHEETYRRWLVFNR